ncbi:MAG: hypothetical protein JSU65_13050 [Candidatus Zixiibacteriota bacterium]|nr:MAG: hypothetical protein JSU65_13050 [candidate division Zixibacteria bacterium]
MYCAHCNEKFTGKPVIQGGEYYCSLECANLVSGIVAEEKDEYFEEEPIEDLYQDAEE